MVGASSEVGKTNHSTSLLLKNVCVFERFFCSFLFLLQKVLDSFHCDSRRKLSISRMV